MLLGDDLGKDALPTAPGCLRRASRCSAIHGVHGGDLPNLPLAGVFGCSSTRRADRPPIERHGARSIGEIRLSLFRHREHSLVGVIGEDRGVQPRGMPVGNARASYQTSVSAGRMCMAGPSSRPAERRRRSTRGTRTSSPCGSSVQSTSPSPTPRPRRDALPARIGHMSGATRTSLQASISTKVRPY